MQTTKTKRLVESALLLALATVLSELPLAELPYGGSITVASMFPVLLIAYRYGTPWGVGCATVFGIIQQLFGLKNISYFSTWQSIVVLILLDYIIAFALIGLAGVFRKVRMSQNLQFLGGALLVCLLRYACHVVTGATIWAGLSIPDSAALTYSFIYNATYMVPETLVLCLVSYYLGSVLDFGRSELRRLPAVSTPSRTANVLLAASGLLGTGALIFDFVMIFARMQDPESGEFSVALLRVDRFIGSFWMTVTVVSAVAALAVAVLMIIRRLCLKRLAAA